MSLVLRDEPVRSRRSLQTRPYVRSPRSCSHGGEEPSRPTPGNESCGDLLKSQHRPDPHSLPADSHRSPEFSLDDASYLQMCSPAGRHGRVLSYRSEDRPPEWASSSGEDDFISRSRKHLRCVPQLIKVIVLVCVLERSAGGLFEDSTWVSGARTWTAGSPPASFRTATEDSVVQQAPRTGTSSSGGKALSRAEPAGWLWGCRGLRSAGARGSIPRRLCGVSGPVSQVRTPLEQLLSRTPCWHGGTSLCCTPDAWPPGSPPASSSVLGAVGRFRGKESGWQGSSFQLRFPVTGHRPLCGLLVPGSGVYSDQLCLEGEWPWWGGG